MTTATTPRPQHPHSSRPGASPAGGAAMAPIDPIRLIKQYAPLLGVCVVLGLALGLAAHVVLLKVAPRYESFVLYEISPPNPDITDLKGAAINQEEHARFMGTQKEIMVSDAVMQAALKDPQVARTEWAKPFLVRGAVNIARAQKELEKRLSSRVLTNTNIIQLKMTGRNAEDVATIVNAVNRAYMEDIRRSEDLLNADKRDALAKLLNETRAAIKMLEAQRDQLVGPGGLNSIDSGSDTATMELLDLGRAMVEVQGRIASVQSILEGYERLVKEGRVVQYPDRIRETANMDPLVRSIDQEISSLKADESALLLQRYGPNHPMIQIIRDQLEAKKRERQSKHEEVMRQLFDAEVDQSRTMLASLQAQLAEIEAKRADAQKRKEAALAARMQAEQIEKDIEIKIRDANQLDATIKTLNSTRELKVANRVRVLRQGQIPQRVSFPRLVIMLPLGAVLLPALVGGVVLLRELFDQRVRGPADIAIIPRLRVLGVIPSASEDPARPANVATAFRDSPGGAITESFRQLMAPLTKRMDQMGHKSLLVVPGMPGSGGTSTVTNLAMIAAASDQRVLIIDANLRRPGIHRVFGLRESPGLGDVLCGSATLQSAVQATDVENLSVLPAGSPAGRRMPERLSSESMTALLREAADAYDLVLVDASPAIVSGDGLALANRCDASIIVVRALAEKRGLVARLQGQFGDCRAELLGVVLNGARSSAGGYFRRNIKATHEYQKVQA